MTAFPVPGDVVLTADGRDIVFVSDVEALAQRIRNASQIFKGLYKYDKNLGLPYFDQILVKGGTKQAVAQIFRSWLVKFPGVVNVERCEVSEDRESRMLTVDFRVLTSFGVPLDLVLKYEGI